MNRTIKRSIGVLFWLFAVGGAFKLGVDFNATPHAKTASTPAASVIEFFAGPKAEFKASDPTRQLAAQDPIFLMTTDGEWIQVGYISAVTPGEEQFVDVFWYSNATSPQNCQLVQHRNSGELAEVITTMLPPETRRRIEQRLAAAMNEHGDALSSAFIPLVQASWNKSMPVIEQEFRASINRHRPDIDRLIDQWNDDVIKKRLLPLARSEILPIVRKHGKPPAETIGQELWSKASLWRFGWRAIYDQTRVQKNRKLLREEWDRFVKDEAVRVFESHTDEIVVAIQRMTNDIIRNKTIRGELEKGAANVISTPETQRLVQTILRESLIDNRKVRRVWIGVWSSDEAQEALELAGDILEPVVRSIGDDVFGSESLGINPNFARVLRNQILRKDQRWIVAIPNASAREPSASPPVIQLSQQSMPYPIVHLANPDD